MGWLTRFGKGRTSGDPLMVVPIPPLVSLLRFHEDAKGAPLDEAEVLAIRDGAVCMTMRRSQAEQLAAERGYADVDPADPWNGWLRLRD